MPSTARILIDRIARAVLFPALITFGFVVAHGQSAPPPFTPGEAIEVEMSGVWTPAKFVQRQNQFVQVRYPDGTEAWLPAARVRVAGSKAASAPATAESANPDAAAAAPAEPTPPHEGDPAAAAPPIVFRPGQKAECKWGHTWSEVVIKNKRASGWHLVQYTSSGERMEWVEPWRLRSIGSTEDTLEFVHRNPVVTDPARQPPPTPAPGPAPVSNRSSAPAPTTPARPAPTASPARPAQMTEDPGAILETDFVNDPNYKRADYSRVQELDSQRSRMRSRSGAATSFQPDPAAPVAILPGEVRALELAHGGSHFNYPIQSIELTRADRPRLLVELQPFNNRSLRPRIERLDLTDLRSIGVTPIPLGTRFVAASPDGLRFAVSQAGNGERDRIEVWDWPIDGPAARVLVFYPYRKTDERTRHVIRHVSFLDRDTLVTLGGVGASAKDELVVWDVTTAQAKFSLPHDHFAKPIFSPGGNQVAVQNDEGGVRVFDLVRGAIVATLEDVSKSTPGMSFTGTGDRLFATTVIGNCDVYDLATGARVSRVFNAAFHGDADPFVDRYVAVNFGNGFILTDPDFAAEVWRYMPDAWLKDFKIEPGGIVVYGSREGGVCVAALPQPAALQAAKALSPETALSVRPGVAVSLVLNLDATNAEKAAVETALRAELAESQLVVKPGQPLRLVATTGLGKPTRKEIRAEVVMTPTGATTVGESGFAEVTPRYCKLALELNGSTLWEQGDKWNAESITNRPDIDLQAAVDAAAKYPFEFYTTVDIPERVAAPRGTVPETTFTATGASF